MGCRAQPSTGSALVMPAHSSPAADIQRLLKSGAKAKGLTVPGMPMGSPGMEGPRRDPFTVMLFDGPGKVSVYQKYSGD